MKPLFALLLILIMLPAACPMSLDTLQFQKLDVKYRILDNDTVETMLGVTLAKPINESFNMTLENSTGDIKILAGIDPLGYSISQLSDVMVIDVPLNYSITQFNISYTTASKIYQQDKVKFFFDKLPYRSQKLSATIELPVGYLLHENTFTPTNAKVISNGKQILLNWVSIPDQPAIFSLEFEQLENQDIGSVNRFWSIITSVIIFGGSLLITSVIMYFRKKNKHSLLVGFREDEKRAIEYLQKNKTTWQNKLQKEYNFSRAKTTRIIKKFEEAGMVRKENYGRTNKIIWLR